ncbi:sigma-54-dependent Fis family transcriptional regulator [bacterium]|nr:sigma-54-dependent Fis family transcriptional regulator [bacterium]
MEIQSLKISGFHASDRFFQYRFNLESGTTLENIKKENAPAIFVVKKSEVSHLLLDNVIDRGHKHQGKRLADYMLQHEKIPLIRASYKLSGQFKRGCQSLLKNIEEANRQIHTDLSALKKINDRENIYFIGIDSLLFDTIWDSAGSLKSPSKATLFDQYQILCRPLERSEFYQELLKLISDMEVPEDLRKSYVGESREIKLIRRLILRASQNDDPVLITGETGTGKEVVARNIHNYSPRKNKHFAAINCSAIPTELLETELFGSKKGIYTDAIDRKGVWEYADKGSLFLDEIGDLSLRHQAKILRALDEGAIRKVGSNETIDVDVRIIAATNRDLFSMVRKEQFREDLYYRLRSFLIPTPALRHHPDDIARLARHFWKRYTKHDTALPEDIIKELRQYHWPGNARELKMILSQLVNLFGEEHLKVAHLRAVLMFDKQMFGLQTVETDEKEFGLHRIDCLRRLKRMDEVLRAIEITLSPVLTMQKNEREIKEEIEERLYRHFSELETLLLHPALFRKPRVYSQIRKLSDLLHNFRKQIKTSIKKAVQYWKEDIADQYIVTQGIIIQEIEDIVSR